MDFGKLKIAPIRKVEDFVLEKQRYELPKDLYSLNKKVLDNLHYYETNYFIVLFIISSLICFITPGKYFIGLFAILLSIGSFIYGTSKQPQIKTIYEKHPFLFMFLNLFTAYVAVYFLDSVSVFILSITLPMMIIFAHASLRLKGKETTSSSTIMAFFLKWCQLHPKE